MMELKFTEVEVIAQKSGRQELTWAGICPVQGVMYVVHIQEGNYIRISAASYNPDFFCHMRQVKIWGAL